VLAPRSSEFQLVISTYYTNSPFHTATFFHHHQAKASNAMRVVLRAPRSRKLSFQHGSPTTISLAVCGLIKHTETLSIMIFYLLLLLLTFLSTTHVPTTSSTVGVVNWNSDENSDGVEAI
jgi:hypothetical protein